MSFVEPLPPRVRFELARLPGVTAVELNRATPVRLRAGPVSKQVGLVTLAPGARLRRIVEPPNRVVAPTPAGVILTAALAGDLGLAHGRR